MESPRPSVVGSLHYGTSIFTPYLATFFGFVGIYGPTLASALILIAAAVPGYWVAVALIDKEGRKPIQAIGFLAMAILFFVLFLAGKQLLAAMPIAFFCHIQPDILLFKLWAKYNNICISSRAVSYAI